MSVPGWVTVVGVFMLLIGGCGVFSNIKKINTPKALEQTSEVMKEVTKEIKDASERSKREKSDSTSFTVGDSTNAIEMEGEFIDKAGLEKIENIFGSVDTMLNFSDYYKKWIVRLGIIGCIVFLIYTLAGVLMLMGKDFSLKFTYLAIGLSFAFIIFQIIIMSMDKEGGIISRMSTNVGSYFTIFLNIIILVVVLASDKSFFYEKEIIEE